MDAAADDGGRGGTEADEESFEQEAIKEAAILWAHGAARSPPVFWNSSRLLVKNAHGRHMGISSHPPAASRSAPGVLQNVPLKLRRRKALLSGLSALALCHLGGPGDTAKCVHSIDELNYLARVWGSNWRSHGAPSFSRLAGCSQVLKQRTWSAKCSANAALDPPPSIGSTSASKLPLDIKFQTGMTMRPQ